MKAAWIANAAKGDLSIIFGDTADPSVNDQGVLVAVEAVGLTFGEPHWITNGSAPMPDGQARAVPVIIGHEFAGRVVVVGSDAHGFAVGDRVFGLIDFWRNGAAAELAVALPGEIARVPEGMSSVHAATLPIGALTAWQGLFDHGQLRAGQTVLIHGGTGAVGSFAIQIAREAGAFVLATARGQGGVRFCRELGASAAMDTNAGRFEDMASDVDLVFDTVGHDLLERSWPLVKRGGRLVTISGEEVDAPSPERARSLGIDASFFIVRPDPGQLGALAQWVQEGRLKIQLDAVYPLEEVTHVFTEAGQRGRAGKTVLRI